MSFTVYRSSAGSGKTFALVKEYLKIALSDTDDPPRKFRNILAITFTNKAAAEMKERILRHLGELAAETDSPMRSAIAAETGLDTASIRKRASKVLAAILHHYSDFSIGTIDSFVHRIVRAFAYELKLPVNFEVETDSGELLQRAIDMLINRIGEEEKLTKALVEFTESKTDSEKNWRIEQELQGVAYTLLKDESLGHIEKLRSLSMDDFFRIKEKLEAGIARFEAEVTAVAGEACKYIEKAGVTEESFYRGKQGLGAWFRSLAEGNIEKLEPNSYVIASVLEGKWTSTRAGKNDAAAISGISDELIDCYYRLKDLKEAGLGRYSLYRLMYRNIYSLAVLNETEKMLEDFKNSRNILHISEFNKRIAAIVLEQPIPFIYEHMGEKYSHFLIDEFQDTSELQWQNLLPLIDNSLAESNFNMVVGDGKQAIYRWRGGEVEQFVKLPKLKNQGDNYLVAEREQSLSRHFEAKRLDTNFRSKTEVVEFNNRFFSFASSGLSDELKAIYAGHEQRSNPENKGGGVSIEFIPHEGGLLLGNTCERTAKLIGELKTDGFRLRDIAVLTRNNREGSALALYLSSRNIPVISSDSLLLKNSPVVNFISAALRCISDAGDQVAAASMIEFLLAQERRQELDHLLREISTGTPEKLKETIGELGYDFHPFFLARLPLYELCEELVRIFALGQGSDPYLLFFLDEVLEYSLRNSEHLPDFLEWWGERREQSSLAFPAGAEAVTIMTIHKSKGLEFPAVIFPFANWTEGGAGSVWVNLEEGNELELGSALLPMSSQLEETAYSHLYSTEKNKKQLDNLNLLYVAMTRPAERLYILSSKPHGLRNISKFFVKFLEAENLWDEQKAEFHFGTFSKSRIAEEEESTKGFALDHYVSTPWRDRLRVRTQARELWETDEQRIKKEYGLSLHAALSGIRSSDEISPALHKMLQEGLLEEKELPALQAKLEKLISLPAVKPYFEKKEGVRNESEILGADGMLYRPDRVILEGNNATVIDYKTGKAREEHKTQLEKYAGLLLEMGFKEVKKVLIYTEEERVETL